MDSSPGKIIQAGVYMQKKNMWVDRLKNIGGAETGMSGFLKKVSRQKNTSRSPRSVTRLKYEKLCSTKHVLHVIMGVV